MRIVKINYDLPKDVVGLVNQAKGFYYVFIKENPNSNRLKDNLVFVILVVEKPNGNIELFPRYRDKNLFGRFVENLKLEQFLKDLVNTLKNADIFENLENVITSINPNTVYVYSPKSETELQQIKAEPLGIFESWKNTPLYYFEKKVFTPDEIGEIATELAMESVNILKNS
jgi:hypothetical protein